MNILLAALVVVGVATVTDGDTVRVDGVAVRLHGVSAPEMDEPLGPEAKAFMARLVNGKTVRCTLTGEKSYKREVGTCCGRAGYWRCRHRGRAGPRLPKVLKG